MRSIEEQEIIDRNIIEKLYQGSGITSQFMTIQCPYDIESSGSGKIFCTEVKCFNNDSYSTHIIKKDKVERMLEASKGKGLVYCVICPSSNIVYFYNCHKIDWTKVECKPLKQLKCNNEPWKGSYIKDTYFLPKEFAFMKLPIPQDIQI